MIPALLGNTIGGGLFVGAIYWYLYLTGEGVSIAVDFNLDAANTAIDEAGGPMGRSTASSRAITILPDSGGHLKSSIGRELSAEKFQKRSDETLENVHV